MLRTPIVADALKTVDDNTLMLRMQNGREDSFFELTSRYKHQMVNYLYRMLNDYDTAVELSQEVFLRVFRNIHSYDARMKFSTWIYRIATNLAIDEIRKRKRRAPTLLSAGAIPEDYVENTAVDSHPTMDLPVDPECSILQSEIQEQIMAAINELPEDQKQIFLLKEMEQMNLEEISQITRVKIGTLKSRLFRARSFLQDRLKGYLMGGIS